MGVGVVVRVGMGQERGAWGLMPWGLVGGVGVGSPSFPAA